jgi:hypothetical protein
MRSSGKDERKTTEDNNFSDWGNWWECGRNNHRGDGEVRGD